MLEFMYCIDVVSILTQGNWTILLLRYCLYLHDFRSLLNKYLFTNILKSHLFIKYIFNNNNKNHFVKTGKRRPVGNLSEISGQKFCITRQP